MKKIVLLALLTFSFCTFGFAQDFSFDELVKLRSYTYPSLKLMCMTKAISWPTWSAMSVVLFSGAVKM